MNLLGGVGCVTCNSGLDFGDYPDYDANAGILKNFFTVIVNCQC